jgi:hypothetical protein
MPHLLVSPNVRCLRGTRPVESHIVVLEEPQLHSDVARTIGANNRDDTAARGPSSIHADRRRDHLQRICFGSHSKLDRIRRRK